MKIWSNAHVKSSFISDSIFNWRIISEDLNKVDRDVFDVPLCGPNACLSLVNCLNSIAFSQEFRSDVEIAFAQYLKPFKKVRDI